MSLVTRVRRYRQRRRLNRQMRRLSQAFEGLTLAMMELQSIQWERATEALTRFAEAMAMPVGKPRDPRQSIDFPRGGR